MKLTLRASLQVIAKGEPTKSVDGKSTYYKITILQGAEAGQLSVPEELYRILNVGETANLLLEFNDQYKSIKITGIDYAASASSRPSTTAPATPTPGPETNGKDKQGK